MCLRKISVKKRANKDIECYKIVRLGYYDGTFNSLFFPQQKWEIGVEYNAPRKSRNYPLNEINSGYFHSYANKRAAMSFDNPFKNCVLVKCIIPKGSTYYSGKNLDLASCFASKKLKVVEIIKTYRCV